MIQKYWFRSPAMMKRKDDIVKKLTGGLADYLRK